jgi:hypothetical protein
MQDGRVYFEGGWGVSRIIFVRDVCEAILSDYWEILWFLVMICVKQSALGGGWDPNISWGVGYGWGTEGTKSYEKG